MNQVNVSAGFTVTGLNVPFTLNPGQSYTFSTVFSPTAAGTASGTISVISNASDPTLTIAMTGSATASGQLALSPASLSFGSVVTGQSKTMSATLSASGASVTVSTASSTSAEFKLAGISFPFTLAAG